MAEQAAAIVARLEQVERALTAAEAALREEEASSGSKNIPSTGDVAEAAASRGGFEEKNGKEKEEQQRQP